MIINPEVLSYYFLGLISSIGISLSTTFFFKSKVVTTKKNLFIVDNSYVNSLIMVLIPYHYFLFLSIGVPNIFRLSVLVGCSFYLSYSVFKVKDTKAFYFYNDRVSVYYYDEKVFLDISLKDIKHVSQIGLVTLEITYYNKFLVSDDKIKIFFVFGMKKKKVEQYFREFEGNKFNL